jgi:hypothetical protein
VGLNGVDGGVRGLFYGDAGQLGASLIGILALVAWVAPVAWAAFKVVDKLVGNRVSEDVEMAGLDADEIGLLGYPELSEAVRAPMGARADRSVDTEDVPATAKRSSGALATAQSRGI